MRLFNPEDQKATAFSFAGMKFRMFAPKLDSLNYDGSFRIEGVSDQSPELNDPFQTVTLNKPTIDFTGINNKPAIRFDGVNQYFDLPSVWPNTRNFTFFVVFKNENDYTPDGPTEVLVGPQLLADFPYGNITFGNMASSITGETGGLVGLKSFDPDFTIGYLSNTILAGIHFMEMKLSGVNLTINLDGVSQTVTKKLNFGDFSNERSLKNVKRIGKNVDVGNDYFKGCIGEMTYYDNDFSAANSDIMRSLAVDYWELS